MENGMLNNEQFDFAAFINEYQMFTRTTAQYPSDMAVAYTRLGFLGELGEIANKYKKVIRGDYKLENIKDDLSKEIGDLVWYYVRYLDELDYRASWGFKELSNNIRPVYGLETILTAIAYNFSQLPYKYNYQVLQYVGDYINIICDSLNIKLIDVVIANQSKLQDRLNRNIIKGTGDNR